MTSSFPPYNQQITDFDQLMRAGISSLEAAIASV